MRLTYSVVTDAAIQLADRWTTRFPSSVVPVLQGGLYPASVVAQRLGVPMHAVPTPGSLVVDDIVDSGRTAEQFHNGEGIWFDACFRKRHAPFALDAIEINEWITFPWEVDADGNDRSAEDGVVRLLQHIGEDPTRDGLLDTPRRVAKAMREMTEGYADDPATILATTFDVSCDEMVVLNGIDFVSLCEHHLLPFTGTVAVGYVPGESNRVVGLSKLARLVECFARRLQVQERMTTQIAAAMDEHLQPRGVGVVVTARHSCMGCRGVRKPGAAMTTSALSGFMKDDSSARAEFLALARLHC